MCSRDVIFFGGRGWLVAACVAVVAAGVVAFAGCAESQAPDWMKAGRFGAADAPSATAKDGDVTAHGSARPGVKSTTTIGEENGKPVAKTIRDEGARTVEATSAEPAYRQTSQRQTVDASVPKDRDAYITKMLARVRKSETAEGGSAAPAGAADSSSLAAKLGQRVEPQTLDADEPVLDEPAEADGNALTIEARLPASARTGRARAVGQASADAADDSTLQEKRAAAEAAFGDELRAETGPGVPSKYDAKIGPRPAASKAHASVGATSADRVDGGEADRTAQGQTARVGDEGGTVRTSSSPRAVESNAAKITVPKPTGDAMAADQVDATAPKPAQTSVVAGSARVESTKAPIAENTPAVKSSDRGAQITKIRAVPAPPTPTAKADAASTTTPDAATFSAVSETARAAAAAKGTHPTRVETLDVGPISPESTAQSANNAMEIEDAATMSKKTRGDLNAMIARLEDRLAVHPEDVSTQLKLKMLYAAQGQWDQAIQNASVSKSASDGFTANAFADVVAKTLQVYDDTTLSSAEQANRALQLVERMQMMLKQQADLRITELKLCRSVSNFSSYEEMAKEYFVSGKPRPVVVYVEIDNFTSKHDAEAGHYQTLLAMTVELVNANGRVLFRQAYPRIEDPSKRLRRDFYIAPKPVTLPAMTAGKYTVKVTVEDLLGNKVAQKGTMIEVK